MAIAKILELMDLRGKWSIQSMSPGNWVATASHLALITEVSATASQLGGVLAAFDENFSQRGELGASVSIWWRGQELLHAAQGWCEPEQQRSWRADTLIPVYSATKAPAAAALLLALQQHGLSVQTPVSEIWGISVDSRATVGDLLSHQCGLAALDESVSVFCHEEVAAALARQLPAWSLGEGHGYHPRTYGFLLDELVRRLTGYPLGQWWQNEFAQPLQLDFWIGLPSREWARVARLVPGRMAAGQGFSPFYQEMQRAGSLTRRAFGSPEGLQAVQDMNRPEAWSLGLAGMGGVGTARALAKFYQVLLGHLDGPLNPESRRALAERRIQGEDRVLLQETAFSAGCQLDPIDEHGIKLRQTYGPNVAAFGHPGAGGSHAFADPDSGLSFAYVMNQMTLSVMPGERCRTLIDALYAD